MTTKAQDVGTKPQVTTDQGKHEVGPYVNQNASTMASSLRDFIRMNPPIFFGPKVNEDLQEFLDGI